ADQTKTPDATAIGEGDMFAIWLYPPSRLLVLHRAVIVLKLGIALLAGLLVFTVLIKARDRRPGPISACLTSLGVETCCKRILLGKHCTIALEIIVGDPASIHPRAHAFVADELHNANGFINGLILLLVACYLVLVDQHVPGPFSTEALEDHSFCL